MISIVVPIKQVPDMERVKFNTETGTVDRSSATREINPFDLNALETAVQIKEKLGGTVTVVSMGPPQVESAVKDALSRGADCGISLVDSEFAGADTLATSYTLASAIRKLGRFDLIVCGEKTVDGDTGQVGPEIAEWLGIPHVAYVSEIKEMGEKFVVICEMEGDRYLVESGLPLLITVTKDINTPRLPTFSDKLKARKAKIEKWTAEDLSSIADPNRFGLGGSPTRLGKIVVPSEEGRKGEVFKGSPEETVAKIINALEGEGILDNIR